MDAVIEANAELAKENGRLRKLLADSQRSEAVMARRIEAFRKCWPAIHKDFFKKEGKAK